MPDVLDPIFVADALAEGIKKLLAELEQKGIPVVSHEPWDGMDSITNALSLHKGMNRD